MDMLPLVILLIGIIVILTMHFTYSIRQARISAGIIGEAYRIHRDHPEYWLTYRRDAIKSLEKHGCADLIRHLPDCHDYPKIES